MTTNYSIDTGDGNQLTAGLQGYDQARRIAQQFANERGETLYLYAPSEVREAEERGEEHESEAIEPDEIEVIASYPRATETGLTGAIDLDVKVRRGDWSIEGEITMVLDPHRGNTWVAYGDGPDTWVSADLLHSLRRACDGWDGLRRALSAVEASGAAAAADYEPEAAP